MKIKRQIPNAMTCGNLICGCLGILFTASYRLDIAFYLICIAAVLDFFDGFVARMLKVTSPIGKDLDSLADMVTFGVLPGFIMYKLLGLVVMGFNIETAMHTYSLLAIGEPEIAQAAKTDSNIYSMMLPFIGFLIPVFSAIRLAKFNNDKRQTNSFIGVPTPANALLIGSLGLLIIQELRHEGADVENNYYLVYNLYSLSALTLVMSFLLIAEIPLFALKFKSFGWKFNRIRYTFLISSFALLIVFRFTALPFIIFLYVILSMISNVINRIRNRETT